MTSQRAVAVHNVSVCRNGLPVSVRVQRTCNTIGEPKYSLRAQHGQNPVWSLPVGSKFHTVLCGIMKPHQISFSFIWFVTDSSIIVQLLSALNRLSKSALLSLPKICARQKDSSKQNSTHKIKSRVQSSWGRRERGERVELPDSLVEKAVSQSNGAGLEAAVPSPHGRRLRSPTKPVARRVRWVP